ncbi:MAG: hypothetical protein A2V99_11240 [Spirochaetes bacterium RBG_16_67_19]|nr:MAG: hypothetical protein A2V99_11240 [Spirochaetes bacterium RBG_16_67_19]
MAADPEGRFWGRLEPRYLAALDPASGQPCTRIELPCKPYNHLITTSGKAYVTHSALTKEGFTLSVVDTRRSVMLRELTGIAGLRTDLVQAAGFVYLAVAGVGKENSRHCYLYQIDEATDRIREALHSTDKGFYWKLAAAGERLYLGWLPARDAASSVGSTAFGRVEVRDMARVLGLRAGILTYWIVVSRPVNQRACTTWPMAFRSRIWTSTGKTTGPDRAGGWCGSRCCTGCTWST